MKFTISSTEELQSVVLQILQMLHNSSTNLVTLSGELGAGKTTLVQALANTLGITESVASPTFMIEQRYTIPNHQTFTFLIHLDAYRLEGVDEHKNIGLDVALTNPAHLVCLEWPEMLSEFIQTQKRVAVIITESEGIREISITSHDPQHP